MEMSWKKQGWTGQKDGRGGQLFCRAVKQKQEEGLTNLLSVSQQGTLSSPSIPVFSVMGPKKQKVGNRRHGGAHLLPHTEEAEAGGQEDPAQPGLHQPFQDKTKNRKRRVSK